MATIRKRGEYQWQAQIRRRGHQLQSKTFTTRADAEAWARLIESEMDRGVFVSRAESESTPLRDALDRYAKEISAQKKGSAQELNRIKHLKNHALAHRFLANIRGSDIAAYRDERLAAGYAAASVVRDLSVVSHVFNVARKEWGMESLTNPVELVRKPQLNNARTRRIIAIDPPTDQSSTRTPESERGAQDGELERVVATSGSTLLPSIVWLAVETAMRRGEIVSLRWEHVDLKRRVAHLPATKNGDARDVPLSSRAVAVLQELKDLRDGTKDETAAGDEDAGAGRVFEIRSDAVTRAFERAVARARNAYLHECKEAGQRPNGKFLMDLRFHDLRHEATSRLASIFPMHELTKITGHKDPRMLMRYYHPRAEDLAKRLE